MQTAVIYARYACNKPKEKVEHEICVCKKVASQHHIEVIKVFLDENRSGMTLKRPALKQMISTLKCGIDFVIVYEASQLTRNFKDYMKLKEVFKQNNVDLLITTQEEQK